MNSTLVEYRGPARDYITIRPHRRRGGSYEMDVMLSADDMNPTSLLALFGAAGLSAEIDDDGDIDITSDGIRTFVRLDEDRKIMSLFSIWQLADDASLEDRVELANSLNEGIVMVRFCIRADGALWCDYQLVYEGGLTPEFILRTYMPVHRGVRGRR